MFFTTWIKDGLSGWRIDEFDWCGDVSGHRIKSRLNFILNNFVGIMLWCECCGVNVVVWMLWCECCGVNVVVWMLWCECCGVNIVVWMLWCECCGVNVVVWMLWCECREKILWNEWREFFLKSWKLRRNTEKVLFA